MLETFGLGSLGFSCPSCPHPDTIPLLLTTENSKYGLSAGQRTFYLRLLLLSNEMYILILFYLLAHPSILRQRADNSTLLTERPIEGQ